MDVIDGCDITYVDHRSRDYEEIEDDWKYCRKSITIEDKN
jgi:hypothetical protein